MTREKIYDLIVIGGGPAGMMAAGTAAARGLSVLLVEKNDRLGKKLFITGKGRCNVTNSSNMDEFFLNIPRNPKFMYSSFNALSNTELMNFFQRLGVKLKTERGNRVFPESDKSSDIVKALEKFVRSNNVEMRYNFKVKKILVEDGKVCGIEGGEDKIFNAKKVIIATGGMSYSLTGSTGDGYKLAEKVGHSIISPEGSLVPIETNEKWNRDLQGLSLKNVTLSLFANGKKIFEELGEMIFTHFGISGPIVLSLSAHLREYIKKTKDIYISLDMKPALDFETLDRRLQRDFAKFSRKQIKNSLFELLPKNMIPIFISLCKLDEDKFVNQISKEERTNMVKLLKDMRMSVKRLRPIDEAIVTSGGINVKEINPSTMESKIVKGLYFAGEIIDVDAYTGGFNLQIAFSTGYLAGKSV